jgi:CBS domain-containing protein
MIMTKTVSEIMERDFLCASQADSLPNLLHEMSHRGLGSAPVLDLAGRPLGMATLGDLESCRRIEDVTRHSSRSAVIVPQDTSIEAAAREAAQQAADTLVLVDDQGKAVGVLSALDLLRALLGFDGLARRGDELSPEIWSRGSLLELDAVHHAPDAPGVILLGPNDDIEGRHALWVEAADNMRERLDAMLRLPQNEPELEALLEVYPRTLRFRALIVGDPERRERMARAIANLIGRAAPEAAPATLRSRAEMIQ